MRAKINEIFSSIQGEGPYVGIPQLFIRFAGCNLNCGYCDTDCDRFKQFSPRQLRQEIKKYYSRYHSLVLTGGEPLLWVDFITEFANLLAKEQLIYLETNGTLEGQLEKVIKYIDIIAMDFKLPSSTGGAAYWRQHKHFLEIAAAREVFAKAVVTPDTKLPDLIKTAKIIEGIDRKIPLVLQPVHPQEFKVRDKISKFREDLSGFNLDLRVIPQIHKVIGVQ
jgi:organic radical activating enzyme